MVLSKLRPRVQRSLSVLGGKIGHKIKADYVTIMSPFIAILVPVSVYYGNVILAFIFILFTGFLDILDGAIARSTGSTGSKGAFLDSMTDRFVDTIYYSALVIAGYDSLLVLIGLGLTITITYSKARVASLGGEIRHHLMERSDRIIIISALILLSRVLNGFQKDVVFLVYDILLFIASIYAVYLGIKILGKSD